MRMHPIISLALLAIGVAACDQSNPPLTASLGNVTVFNSPFQQLITTPSIVTLAEGQSVQLVTNAPDTLRVSWSSLQPTVATVTQTGVVTALGVGTATIAARLTIDSTIVGPATIIVFLP